MILNNRWAFFDKKGNNMNLTPLYGVNATIIDPTESGNGAILYAYTDVSGQIIHVEIVNGGNGYSGASYLEFTMPSSNTVWTTDPSDLTVVTGVVTAFVIPLSTQNSGFPYPSVTWTGENYFDEVSINLIESEQIFILEEVEDSVTGATKFTYPRIDEYGPYSFTTYEGDGTYIKIYEPGHPIIEGMEIRLYGGTLADGVHTVQYITKDSFFISSSLTFAPILGAGYNYGIVPKIRSYFQNGDDEIFYYTVEYNLDYPTIRKGTELHIVPVDASQAAIPDIMPTGNSKYIRAVDATEITEESIQINLGFQSEYEGVFIKNVIIVDETLPYSLKLIAQLSFRAESIGEDERLNVLLNNFGQQIGLGEEAIFRDSDVNESYPDYELLNVKRKELLLEHSNIFPYLGSYKGLVNIVNWFGYPDLRIKEYWLNIDINDQYFGKYKQTQIPLQLKNKGTSGGVAENASMLPNSVYKKTSLFGLYYDVTREDGTYNSDGTPNTEDAFVFTNEEVLIKLFSLKKYLKAKFLPLSAQIVDIVGEGIYFERYVVNAWKDDVNIFTITPTNTADFIADNTEVYVRDLRLLNPTGLIPQPNNNTPINQYYSKYNVKSIDVVSGGVISGGVIPQLDIIGDSSQSTTAIVKVRAIFGTYVIPSTGLGYSVGDVITLGGGVYDSPIRITVTTVGGAGDVTAFSVSSGPDQGSNYLSIPTTFSQAYSITIVGTSYAPGTGLGFTFLSSALSFEVESIRISQYGLGYITQPSYSFTPITGAVLTLNLEEIENDNYIAYFSNYDSTIQLNDSPNIPVGAVIDLTCTSFNVTWDDAAPYTWKSLEGSEEATITPIVSYLPSGSGQVTGFVIVNGGFGYKSAPIITITGGGGFAATATCTILNGVVNTVSLVAGGAGYVSDPDVKVDGGITNTLYSWANIGKGDYYEMEWRIKLSESQQNQQYSKSIRGTVGNLEKYQFIVPYIGKYDVEMYLYDTDNNFTNEYKNYYINSKLPQVDFSYITRYSDCRDTWDEFGNPPLSNLGSAVSLGVNNVLAPGPVVNYSTWNDTPVSWGEIFGRWINPIYVNTKWDDAIVNWSRLETSEIDTINNYSFPPTQDFAIERLSPYDLKEGTILSVDATTNTIIVSGQILRPELRAGNRIYLRRDLNIFEFLVSAVLYTTPGQTSITVAGTLPSGLNNTWEVLRESESIIEVAGNVIYDAVSNLTGFKIGNYIKIKGEDNIPKAKRIPVITVNTNPISGDYQSIDITSVDPIYAEINEIGQLYKLRDYHPTNGNFTWDPVMANTCWDLRPVLEGPYPGIPSDYKGKLYINKSPGAVNPITTADPVSEIRPGFTIITVFVLDLNGFPIYEQRLRSIHIFENRSTSGTTWNIWQEPGVVGPPFDPSNIVEIDVEAIDRGRLSDFFTIASTPGNTVWMEYEYETFPTRVENLLPAVPGVTSLEFNFNTHPASAMFDSSTFPPTLPDVASNSCWFYDHGIVSGDFSMEIINTGISTVTGNTLITVNDTDYEIGRSSGSFLATSRDFDEDYAEQRLGTLILKWKNFNENNWTQFCSQTWDTLSYHENIYCGWYLQAVATNGVIQFNAEPSFSFQTITGLLSLTYTWRFALEELLNTDNSGLVRFYYKMDPAYTKTVNSTQVLGNTFIIVDDSLGMNIGDTMIGLGIPFNASISLITAVPGGFQLDLVDEVGAPIAVTETLSQRVEVILSGSLTQRILATAKNPGADSLGYLSGTNGVFFYDPLDLGAVTICHTFPLGNMGTWLNNSLVGGNQGGRDRLILRYPNLQTYFYEGQNPSGGVGWYPSANLNYLYDSTDDIWQSYRLPYERSICGSWSYEETKIGSVDFMVPTGSSVMLVPDNCKIAGKTGFRWRISEQLTEDTFTNLAETIDSEIMWTFSHPGKYNIELMITDTNGNVGTGEKKQFITVYDEE
jgi:hypothetical protein